MKIILSIILLICILSIIVKSESSESKIVDSVDLNYFYCKQECSDSCPSYPMEGHETKFTRNNIHVTEDRFNGDMFVFFKYNAINKTVYVQGNEFNNANYIEQFQYPIVNPSNIANENCIVIINNKTASNQCFSFVVCNNSFTLSSPSKLIIILFSIISLLITFII